MAVAEQTVGRLLAQGLRPAPPRNVLRRKAIFLMSAAVAMGAASVGVFGCNRDSSTEPTLIVTRSEAQPADTNVGVFMTVQARGGKSVRVFVLNGTVTTGSTRTAVDSCANLVEPYPIENGFTLLHYLVQAKSGEGAVFVELRDLADCQGETVLSRVISTAPSPPPAALDASVDGMVDGEGGPETSDGSLPEAGLPDGPSLGRDAELDGGVDG